MQPDENAKCVIASWPRSLSHAIGTATNDFRAPQATYNIAGEYGNLEYDRRHIFSGSYVYNLPFLKNQQGLVGHALGGWEVAGILYANTGSHLTASLSRDPAGLGLRDPSTFEGGRPDIVGDPNAGAPHTIDKWFNASAFAAVPAGEIRPGNEPRGTIVGPGYFRWDASCFLPHITKVSRNYVSTLEYPSRRRWRAIFLTLIVDNLGWIFHIRLGQASEGVLAVAPRTAWRIRVEKSSKAMETKRKKGASRS